MADTILNGDVTVAYLDETRQKRIYWSGGPHNTYTMNELYSALMDHFDEPLRMDNPSPMSAQTPVEYTTGIIDSGDSEPWHITYETMEHMTGGALRTSGWTRDLPGDGTGAVGLVVVSVTAGSNNILATDVGSTITHADGDSGTLLEIISNGGTNDYFVIRPASNALANDFNSTSLNLTCNTRTAPQNAAGVSGEQIWANLYSIGTIEADTHLYLYQGSISDNNRTRITSVNDNTKDYWDLGHIDLCLPIRDFKSAGHPIIDGGYATAYARKGTTEYAHFEVATSTTSGGRNPVPVGTKSDLNNTTGTGNLAWDNGSTETLVDLELLYNVGTTTVGNMAAGIQDDGGVFTDDTTDLNDVGGAGDVPVHPAVTVNDDAFYFGMEYPFTYLLADVQTAATATAAGTTWEYYDGTTWSALTVTDDSDSANGAFTAGTGRYVISWDLPTDWSPTTVTNQPAALVTAYYVRIRVSNATNYTAGATLETAWAAGETQLKGIVRDSTITTPGGATGNTDYYLVGESQHDFADNDVVLAGTSRKAIDISGTPTAQGPALATWFTNNTPPTLAFAATTFDTDDDGTDEYYGITIDCNQNPLTEVYEWLKYVTGNGYTTLLDVGGNSTGIEGEQYIGGVTYLSWDGAESGTIAEGDDVTQAGSGATGIILAWDPTNNKALLRNVRGTFNTTGLITGEQAGTWTPNLAAETFAPNSVSPFGTFAGGTFFGARGVLLTDWVQATDENSFQLTPMEGGTKSRPIAISLTVSNLIGTDEATLTDDRVTIFRLTGAGGTIDKEEYSPSGGEAIGSTTIAISTPIAQDVPGKALGGVVKLRDADNNNKEYRMRFSSWNNTTNSPNGEFVLANVVPSNLTGSTNSTTIVSSTDELDGLKRGDLVLNTTRSNAVSYITSVNATTNTVTIDPAITDQVSTDSIEFNANPVIINAADDIYVPLLDTYATATTAAASIVYSSPINFRVVARNSTNNSPDSPITPFTTDDATSGTDRSNAVVRTFDTIRTF
jgi:hypothetical protein